MSSLSIILWKNILFRVNCSVLVSLVVDIFMFSVRSVLGKWWHFILPYILFESPYACYTTFIFNWYVNQGTCWFSQVTENGKQERHLVTTVGKFSVMEFPTSGGWIPQMLPESGGFGELLQLQSISERQTIVDSRFMHEKFTLATHLKHHLWWRLQWKLAPPAYQLSSRLHMRTFAFAHSMLLV